MAPAVATYEPRAPSSTILYNVIAEHLETFLASLDADLDAKGLPDYVQREFYDYLQCGILAHGFLRLGCESCKKEVLLRTLREIMEHIYALFDRRCRTQTALDKLNKLRQWVKRFKWIGDTLKKVFAPTLEKALTFLDDKLLPGTSNAVERGNRRHRKMQKSVDRVRSQVSLEGRIALDMIRESRAEHRAQTIQAFHQTRRGSP